MTQDVRITDGANICVVRPDLGGSIVEWSVDGQNMLRRADAAAINAGDPLRLSTFPLIPYSNRIGFAAFEWEGHSIALKPNFAPEPHAVHGIGWMMPWQIENASSNHATLKLDHHANAYWHWPFSATQTLTLSDKQLVLELSATNKAQIATPMAFGHHPYFDAEGASLFFKADRVYTSDTNSLPGQAMAPEGTFAFDDNGEIAGRDVDHCYAGWDGKARIVWDNRKYGLDIAADMAAAVVYIPKEGASFCFEPVPHINNSLNRMEEQPAIPVLMPGETFSATITMRAVAG